MSHIAQFKRRGEDWMIPFFYFPVNQIIQAVLSLSQLLPCPVTSILLPSPCSWYGTEFWLKEMCWPFKSGLLPSCLQSFPYLLRRQRARVVVVLSSLQLEEQHVSSISPIQVLLFFLSCLLGYSFSFIFLAERQESQPGKNTAHMSSVITWPLCQALACWQFQGSEWVTPNCSQQEERGKEILIWLGLHSPSLLFPSIFLLLGEPQLLLQTISSPHSSQDCWSLACAAFCPLSSTH